jgi:hypothetical protein
LILVDRLCSDRYKIDYTSRTFLGALQIEPANERRGWSRS